MIPKLLRPNGFDPRVWEQIEMEGDEHCDAEKCVADMIQHGWVFDRIMLNASNRVIMTFRRLRP